MRLHNYIFNLITNIMNFELEYYYYNNRNPTILSYVRYDETSRNEKKSDKNISDYLRIEKNISNYN